MDTMKKEALIQALADVLASKDDDSAETGVIPSQCPYVGMEVIVRSADSGVHFGTLKEYYPGGEVLLEKSRRLWEWKAVKGFTLSAVAQYGIDHDESKISTPVDIYIIGVCEIIPCSVDALHSIRSASSHNE